MPFDFNLGYVGYLGYELKVESGGRAAYQAEEPDAAILFADRMIVVDHVAGETYLLALSLDGADADALAWLEVTGNRVAATRRSTVDGSRARATRWLDIDSPGMHKVAKLRHDRDAYLKRIRECFHEIDHGESYEVCLTNEVSLNAEIDPLSTYTHLRAISPVPYGAFLDFPGVSVMCASPERFLSIGVGPAWSRPSRSRARAAARQHAASRTRRCTPTC